MNVPIGSAAMIIILCLLLLFFYHCLHHLKQQKQFKFFGPIDWRSFALLGSESCNFTVKGSQRPAVDWSRKFSI